MTPALLIGAARSSSGKTTVALGLMRALARRGLRVAAVKCGPDYIDPAFHAAATGRASLNLDSWTMAPDLVGTLAAQAGADADILIAEGAMGLFDGVPGAPGRTGASADIAAALGWPVLLVHDVTGQGRTAAALIHGLASYDPRVKIAGVVLNRVASPRHEKLTGEAIAALGLPLLGALPREAGVELPERHLGLVQAQETQRLDELLDALAQRVEAHLDIDAALAAARASTSPLAPGGVLLAPPAQRIAVARDAAFSFFYPHHAQSWRRAGTELAFFSPLADEPPPMDCDLVWLPGGYPELHAGRLAANHVFLNGLRAFAASRPVHGECGGYMVLGDALVDADGQAHAMAGLLRLETSFARRKMTLGYRCASTCAEGVFGPAGAVLHGHEFHYATIVREEGAPFAMVTDAYSDVEMRAGLRLGVVSGSFFHYVA